MASVVDIIYAENVFITSHRIRLLVIRILDVIKILYFRVHRLT